MSLSTASPPAADEIAPAPETPEMTAKAIVLGLLLAVVLGAANAYVGLRIGLTVSASIPAAVMSMGILRLFKSHTILENNMVQTIASAGEALAAGVIFTIPAFVIAGQWSTIQVLPTMIIAALGGTLGVLFTIPLRRAYIIDAKLPFPEGAACAEVLEVGEEGGAGVKFLYAAIVVGGLYSFAKLGMRLWGDGIEGAKRVGNSVAYFGTNLAPILLGVGYIVGLRISVLIFFGGALAWMALIPAFMAVGAPAFSLAPPFVTFHPAYDPGAFTATSWDALLTSDPVSAANHIWSRNIRLVGGGAMITGGLYTLYKVRGSLVAALRDGARGLKRKGATHVSAPARTERDLPLPLVLTLTVTLMLAVFGVFWYNTGSLPIAVAAALAAAIAGFFFSAVAGYMAGIVGSSNNPISGVTIVTLIFTALLVLGVAALFGITLAPGAGFAAALGVGAVIACGAAMAGDNLQDLKTGYMVGATPARQQTALVLGVLATALVAAPVLLLLDGAYHIGSPALVAPQATLMANILNGIFGGTLDYSILAVGMLLGVVLIALKQPVMAVAVGVYLPFLLSVPILAGGLLAWWIARRLRQGRPSAYVDDRDEGPRVTQPTREAQAHAELESRVKRNGLLFASGLIAGEAVMGVLMAPLLVLGVEPALFAPLVLGLFGAGAVAIFLDKLPRKGLVAGGVALVGGLVSLALWAVQWRYTFTSSVNWPGLLVLAYVALLLAYLPARELWIASRRP